MDDAGGGGRAAAEDLGGPFVGAVAAGGGEFVDGANAGKLTTAAVTLAGTVVGNSPPETLLFSLSRAVPELAASRFLTTHALPGSNLK